MKKRLLGIVICAVMVAALFAGCGGAPAAPAPAAPAENAPAESAPAPAESGPAPSIGITIQSLENAYWAGVFAEVENLLREKGWQYTIVDCKDNSGTQISQIENFISAGVDVIMIHASDPHAVEDVAKQARDAGIKVMCWDDKMTNTDINWVLDNTALGYEIGSAAANFINEHYSEDNKAEVAVINYPQLPILLERENGILAALAEISTDKYTVVAQQPAVDAATALSHMETILQANPNVKIVCSIGAGGDIGANQAFMAMTNGNIPDDMGIFSADATEQQLQAILDGEASRVSVGFEGSNKRTAAAVVDLYAKLYEGVDFPERDIIRPLLPIDRNNAETYLADFR